jgi:hypothetical protein
MSDDKHNDRLQELMGRIDRMMDTAGNAIYKHDIDWLTDRDMRRRLYDEKPECFVSINVPGYNPIFLPICNRRSLQDPKIIDLSMRLVKKLNTYGKLDSETKDVVLAKLVRIKKRADKNVPTPYKGSVKKSKITKYLTNIGVEVSRLRKQQYRKK